LIKMRVVREGQIVARPWIRYRPRARCRAFVVRHSPFAIRGAAIVASLSAALVPGCSESDEQRPGARVDAGAIFVSRPTVFQHRFTVTNTTRREVKILGVRPSCACSEAKLQHAYLPPGGSTTLELLALIHP
jgi:hypothetical protein